MKAAKWAARAAGSNWIAAAALFALNLWICGRLFRIEYSQQFGSVEGFFLGLERYISLHWGSLSWWPLWHCGMPFQDTYVPLLHLLVAAVATLGRISVPHAYHDVTGVTYSLGAVAVFLMALRLGAGRGAALLAALFYSVFSPSVLLLPKVATDLGGYFYGRRLQVLTRYGEGPHITALTILPLVILALQAALEKRTWRRFGLAALAFAAIILTNIPGTMALGVAVFCWICVQPAGNWRRAWIVAGGAACLGYAIACYGVPPSSWRTVVSNVLTMHVGFHSAFRKAPLLLALALFATAALGYLLRYLRLPLYVRFGITYFAILAVMVKTADPLTFEMLPQVSRLHVELELAACLLLGAMCWWIYSRSPRWTRYIFVVLAVAAVYIQVRNYHKKAREDMQIVDLKSRSEFTSARWLNANLPGQRVYACGSGAFWLNAFTDVPQVEGCCDQGQQAAILRTMPYMVGPNVSPEFTKLTVAHLQALGAHALLVSGADSTDEFKEVQSPERYAAVMPVLHREHGDIVYGVPQRDTSLAHVLRAGEAVASRDPKEPDAADVVRYAAAIEDQSRPSAEFQWIRPDTAHIRAVLQRDDLLSVQVAWFSGWRATVNGSPRPVSMDGLGFILIHPECENACEVTLTWTGPPDLKYCVWISGLSLAFALFLVFATSRRSSAAPEPQTCVPPPESRSAFPPAPSKNAPPHH